MGDIGTFGSFTTARLGIYAAQKGLSVTGNNIANINTVGYTRQALDQVSLNMSGGDRYRSRVNVGSGVRCVSVSQLRDPYLDIRYRTEMGKVGAMDSKLSGLDRLSAILDEVAKNDGDGVLEKMFTDLTSALDDLSLNAGQDAYDSAVRSSAQSLVKQLNAYAKSLNEVKNTTVDELRQNITTVNGILSNIRDLNSSIRKSELHGDNALELRDQRNLLIDQLSQYIKIDVSYTAEDIGGGQTVDKLVITMGNANPDSSLNPETDRSVLVDGSYVTQLLTPLANPGYDPTDPATKRYLDINNLPTDDPSQAKQVFDDNYNIMLGALTDVNGEMLKTTEMEQAEIDKDVYDAMEGNGYRVELEKDAFGNVTKLAKYVEILQEVAAKVSTDALVTTGPIDASGLKSFAAAIAKAGNAVDGITDGPVTIRYDAGSSKLLMSIGDKVIGESKNKVDLDTALTDPLLVTFQRTDNGLPLGSVKLAANTTANDLDNAAGVGTGLAFTAATTQTVYYKRIIETQYFTPVTLHDNDLYGSLQSTREMLTEKGEFATAADVAGDPDATIKRGIPYYQKTLDALAQQLAKTFNEANNVWQVDKDGNYLDADGNILTVAGDKLKKDSLTEDQRDAIIQMGHFTTDADGNWFPDMNDYLEKNGGKQLGGVLFSDHGSKNTTAGITASTISISQDWAKGQVRICCSTQAEPGSQANDNVLHMITLMGTKLEYLTDDGQTFFTGSFQEMLSNITTTLADDVSVTSIALDNAYGTAVELDTSRDSVSGVDLNDEAMGMMQYQKSYAAACRLLTTLDEMMDKLINGTGIAGR